MPEQKTIFAFYEAVPDLTQDGEEKEKKCDIAGEMTQAVKHMATL